MQPILLVGLGGFIGSVLRYGLGRIPITIEFPLMTIIINFIGSFIIGMVFEFAKNKNRINPNAVLFLQTGFCGGFTTFSTFSLETVVLLQNNKYLTGSFYAVLSVILCLAGTILGMLLARTIRVKLVL